ncbi:MAG: alpha/beta hydrolase [Bacteroidales bacterium]|nr:alpha/beta hydrolase [Bacteroidales bacterium]
MRILRTLALLAVLSAMTLTPAAAQMTFTLPVSPDGEATLTAFLPEHPDGRAILAFPGGGYRQTSIGNNAQWAPLYNSLGISYFILKYRMPEGRPETTLDDAQEAMRIIRKNAWHWNINPDRIGVMGTSAGGHLASTMATSAPGSLRPAFQILFYPVITFGEGCHKGSRDNFLGQGNTDPAQVERYSSERQVTAQTPPALIFASSDDRGVPPEFNAAAYYIAMTKQGCSASLHIFPEGGHGWTFASPFRYHDQVVDELTAWLEALQF